MAKKIGIPNSSYQRFLLKFKLFLMLIVILVFWLPLIIMVSFAVKNLVRVIYDIIV